MKYQASIPSGTLKNVVLDMQNTHQEFVKKGWNPYIPKPIARFNAANGKMYEWACLQSLFVKKTLDEMQNPEIKFLPFPAPGSSAYDGHMSDLVAYRHALATTLVFTMKDWTVLDQYRREATEPYINWCGTIVDLSTCRTLDTTNRYIVYTIPDGSMPDASFIFDHGITVEEELTLLGMYHVLACLCRASVTVLGNQANLFARDARLYSLGYKVKFKMGAHSAPDYNPSYPECVSADPDQGDAEFATVARSVRAYESLSWYSGNNLLEGTDSYSMAALAVGMNYALYKVYNKKKKKRSYVYPTIAIPDWFALGKTVSDKRLTYSAGFSVSYKKDKFLFLSGELGASANDKLRGKCPFALSIYGTGTFTKVDNMDGVDGISAGTDIYAFQSNFDSFTLPKAVPYWMQGYAGDGTSGRKSYSTRVAEVGGTLRADSYRGENGMTSFVVPKNVVPGPDTFEQCDWLYPLVRVAGSYCKVDALSFFQNIQSRLEDMKATLEDIKKAWLLSFENGGEVDTKTKTKSTDWWKYLMIILIIVIVLCLIYAFFFKK